MKQFIWVSVVTWVLAVTPVLGAAEGTGTTGAALLQYNFSPRAEAMGEAYVAVVDDVHAVAWNPAALIHLQASQVSASWARGLAGETYAQLGVGWPLSGEWAVGTELLSYTGGDFDWVNASGEIRRVSAQNDFLLAVAGAWQWRPGWSAGLSVELFHSTLLEDVSGTTAALSAGLLAQPLSEWPVWVGAVVRHAGLPMGYGGGETDPLPLTGQAGVAVQVLGSRESHPRHSVIVAVDGVWSLDEPVRLNLGGEYWLWERVAIRGGYKVDRDVDGLTLGAGVRVPLIQGLPLQVDYSYSFVRTLDALHRLSLSLYFPNAARPEPSTN